MYLYVSIYIYLIILKSCCVSFLLYDDIKQDAITTTAYRKRLIELLKERKIFASSLSKIRENTGGYAEQYRCASAL